MNITSSDAIISALCYADIFEYPLTEYELRTWAPFCVARPPRGILHGVALQKLIYRAVSHRTIYYSLRPIKRLIAIRSKREAWSTEKWRRARKIARLLSIIFTIQLVGVTGGLTRSNTKSEDDIDFLIITAGRTLWVTRALSTILLDVFRLRRRPTDMNVRNLVCLNMFMSEDGLSVPKKERDLFAAHEVLLMTPLLDRNKAYEKFLSANRWVKTFLPNAWKEKGRMKRRKMRENSFGIWHLPVRQAGLAFSILEPLARVVQLWYMRKRRSTEIVTDTVIRFHPRDARGWIKRKLGERLTRFNIPLDKIFYGR